MKKNNIYTKYIKNLFDRLLAALGLIAFCWLFVIIALAIRADSPGPIFLKQKRIGKNKDGKITYFNIYKFRTMRMDTPEVPTHMLENPEHWITRVGRILRKTSLDELPQLWNIAIPHNLSIVGPRPGLWNQNDLYAEREKYGANDVLPGLTGWAQINGRDELNIYEKAALDGEYAQNVSFLFDAKCFLGTISVVLKHDTIIEGKQDVPRRK